MNKYKNVIYLDGILILGNGIYSGLNRATAGLCIIRYFVSYCKLLFTSQHLLLQLTLLSKSVSSLFQYQTQNNFIGRKVPKWKLSVDDFTKLMTLGFHITCIAKLRLFESILKFSEIFGNCCFNSNGALS